MIIIKDIDWDLVDMPQRVKSNAKMVHLFMQQYSWLFLNYHEKTYTLNLIRNGVKMNVYLSTMTIQTAMKHPKKGKTQLNRKNLGRTEVEEIFKNPRKHTGKGYY